ncbi:uncharacterized protein HRG_02406 [Hirsutella rhossiliensis]|uniref:Uncharacterized protein n=1 Tax=Hirsutella rhossiliensis TaxID=111463 RepID=A0A9P8N5J4_9HYPO|nr:uncharacterized protein HRG_02406 [Hirsutella rhossiliensis]KAH0966997.1 hypothetical protein HRG_02406 [Hirsutella rhossiliensis]
MVLTLVATTVLSLFLTQRVLAIRAWSRLPLVVWLVFAIYIDSYVFVFASALLQHAFGPNSSPRACDSTILLCLILIYLFLVEKAHIMRPAPKLRRHSKLYLFHSLGILGAYIVVILLNFIFRIAKLANGWCIIGMRSLAMIPLISFDTFVNVYLTLMFLIPLKGLYSFGNMPRSPASVRLRTVAFRTFCGAVFTSLSSIVNLTVLMVLDGEPGWVCLMCCNCDILFSAVVIQWVTSRDNAGTSSSTSSRGVATARYDATTTDSFRASTPCPLQRTPSMLADMIPISTRASLFCRDETLDVPRSRRAADATASTRDSETGQHVGRNAYAAARESSGLSVAGSCTRHPPTTMAAGQPDQGSACPYPISASTSPC